MVFLEPSSRHEQAQCSKGRFAVSQLLPGLGISAPTPYGFGRQLAQLLFDQQSLFLYSFAGSGEMFEECDLRAYHPA